MTMASVKNDNQRIAKNTLFLYSRMFIVMCVSLYTSRVVLDALGVTDFGVYNVVGGLSATFVFFSVALSSATQRFINYALGEGDNEKVKKVFRLSLSVYSLIAIVVVIVGFVLGDWIIKRFLVIPPDKLHAATVVLYTTCVSLALVFVGSVYEAVLIAREDMRPYAYVGLLDAGLKLLVAYLISFSHDRLIAYAWLLLIAQLLPKICLMVYCVRKYSESYPRFFWNKSLFREIFGFSAWNVFAGGAWIINDQCLNILINVFFGPAANTARGVAAQVNNAVNNLASSFFTAVKPQIITRYARGDYEDTIQLMYSSSRFSCYLCWLFALPIIGKIGYILSLWLVEVPEWSSQFVVWIIMYTLACMLYNPIYGVVMATGKLKKIVILSNIVFLFDIPLAYIGIKIIGEPYIIFPAIGICRIFANYVILALLKAHVKLSIRQYTQKVMWPVITVVAISWIAIYFIAPLFDDNIIGLIGFCMSAIMLNTGVIFYIGMNSPERNMVLAQVKKRLHITG